MKINWTVRVKNKVFWVALIPAVLMLIRSVAEVFGISLDFSVLSDQLLAVVEAAFLVLSVLGIVADPTTKGMNDSDQAMTYEEPRK